MAQNLARIEPLQLPDIRRPSNLPSLPEWVDLRLAGVRIESQKSPEGKYREVPTLPANMMLSDEQKRLICRHIEDLRVMAAETPQNSEGAEKATIVMIAKLLMAKPSRKGGEADAEARGEAYLAALDDVPSWAVAEAIRKWHRGECGSGHDYVWAPEAAVLRDLAVKETWRVLGRASRLEALTRAEVLIEYDEGYRDVMVQRLQTLIRGAVSK